MMRIFLFLATNIAVLLVASVTLSLLGVDRYTGQNHGDLLIFCAVFGFSGSLISFLLSTWMAKRSTDTQVIISHAHAKSNGYYKPLNTWRPKPVLLCQKRVFSHPTNPMPLLPAGTVTRL